MNDNESVPLGCVVSQKNADGGKVYCGSCYECLKNEKEKKWTTKNFNKNDSLSYLWE